MPSIFLPERLRPVARRLCITQILFVTTTLIFVGPVRFVAEFAGGCESFECGTRLAF